MTLNANKTTTMSRTREVNSEVEIVLANQNNRCKYLLYLIM